VISLTTSTHDHMADSDEGKESLCGCCEMRGARDAPARSKRLHSEHLVMMPYGSEGMPVHGNMPSVLGVASALSDWAKLVFLATNLPYFGVGGWILASHPVPAPGAVSCCASAAAHGCIVLSLAVVSTYWHGAQCQCAPSLYCYQRETGTARLHSVSWLKRMVMADISCALLTVGVGIFCFGAARTCTWLALPAVFFFLGSMAKRQRFYQMYAVTHGLWHCLSAAAIYGIVLSGVLPWRVLEATSDI